MGKATLTTFPDFTKNFDVYTDASDYQMGGAVSQDGKPIAFFSKKFNTAQAKYTTTEQELLGITETLKNFRTMLLGQKVTVLTDHKNLTSETTKFSLECVLRQRLVLEEYGATIKYIKGEENVLADALSRLDMVDDVKEENFAFDKEPLPPFHTDRIHELLDTSKELKTHLGDNNKTKRFKTKAYGNKQVYYYSSTSTGSHWRLYVPPSLQNELLNWYHDILLHPDISRMTHTIGLWLSRILSKAVTNINATK